MEGSIVGAGIQIWVSLLGFRSAGGFFLGAKNDHLGDPIAPLVSHRFGMSWVLKCGWLVMATQKVKLADLKKI